MNLRKIILNLHLVGGLLSALFLFLLGGSGALLVFEGEIDHTLNAKLSRVSPQGERMSLNALTAHLEQAHPAFKVSGLSLPHDDALAMNVTLRPATPGKSLSLAVNPYTGEELGSLEGANTWMRNVHQFHTRLLLADTGKLITGWSAIFLAGLSVSGLILWWPRKLLKVTSGAAGRKANYELHHVLGFYSSIFMLLFAFTGVVIHWDEQARDLVDRWTGSGEKPAAPKVAPAASGADPVLAEAVEATALKTVPGARVTSIQGLGVIGKPIRVWMKFPEDHTPAGRTNLFLDPVTGAVLSAQDSRSASLGFRLIKLWNREIHTGDLFGWPTRILACLASLALPLLAITGPLIWWGRVRRKGE